MRNFTRFIGCVAILAMPFVGTALANDSMMPMISANGPDHTNNISEMNPAPAGTIVAGQGYDQRTIVNPVEMTNTRDNRGDIASGAPTMNHTVTNNGNWNTKRSDESR